MMSVAMVTIAKFLALSSVFIGMCLAAVVMYLSNVLVHKARLTAARVATDLVACRTRKTTNVWKVNCSITCSFVAMCLELLPVIQATCIGTELEIWMHPFVTLKAHLVTVHLQKWNC